MTGAGLAGAGVLGVVVTDPPRADPAMVAELGRLGVATVHEAAGRTGLLGSRLRPVWPGAVVAGTAVTVLCWPGDNLMIHVAVEQARPGDVLVITTTSPSGDGFVGELITTALAARGVRGLVTTTGVRDTGAIAATRFPVWSGSVSAQGTVKATAGSVNVPICVEGVLVSPGDVIVADDDGVVAISRLTAADVLAKGRLRAEREDQARAAFAGGELSLDRYGLRPELDRLGIRYVSAEPPGPSRPASPASLTSPAGPGGAHG